MCSLVTAYKLNNRLMAAIHGSDYDSVLKCLIQGAKATIISKHGGHTAVGLAAMISTPDILRLLIQSCVEDFDDIFRRAAKSTIEIECDSTPDGMDNLEWEDEFQINNSQTENTIRNDDKSDENTLLYYYYAKTLENMSLVNGDFGTAESISIIIRQDPHALDDMQMSPLHYATAFGNVENARVLIQHGALIDVINTNGFTPLHLGVKSPEITKLLLDRDANPNMKTFGTGMTALHYAITSNPISAKLILYNKTTDLNATDHNDQTPLMVAVVHDCTNMIAKELVSQGAHVNVLDNAGNCPLKYAIIANNLELAEFLLNHGARRLPTHNLLHECVKYNYTEMAALLLKHGEHLYKRNQMGHTPIMTAIRFKKFEVFEFLLKEQVKQQQQLEQNDFYKYNLEPNTNGQYELQVAVNFLKNLQDLKPVARLLFMHGTCATNWLASSKFPEFMSSIITNCKTMSYCTTPLSLSIIMQKYDIAEFLIKEGADVFLLCHYHVINALRSANSPGYAELAQLLVLNGFKYPICKRPFPYYWTASRLKFEKTMIEMCSKPLPLQSLARITIRNHLRKTLNNSYMARIRYCATREQSSLSRIIKELGVPNMLQMYLIDFNDCPTVSSNVENTQ